MFANFPYIELDFAFAVGAGVAEVALAIANARVVLIIISCATSLVFFAAATLTRDDFFMMLLAENADALQLLCMIKRSAILVIIQWLGSLFGFGNRQQGWYTTYLGWFVCFFILFYILTTLSHKSL